MSCTVFSLPIALAYLISAVAVTAVKDIQFGSKNQNYEPGYSFNSIDANEDFKINFKETTYETAYVDKNLLLKTLNEHGVADLAESNNEISCNIEDYTLIFSRENDSEPYLLKIKCPEKCQTEEKINNLNEEYTLNVQEEAYLSIIENLKDNNMSLEKEEVLEDNTIVLTVNIE